MKQAGLRAELRMFSMPGEVRAALDKSTADLLVIDLLYPGESGLDLLRHVCRGHPGIRVLVYTARQDALYVRNCLAAGAQGYVTKGDPITMLLAAVQAVLAGDTYLSPGVQDEMDCSSDACDVTEPADLRSTQAMLSRREREVMTLIGQGMDTNQIAKTLCRSVKTIETYRYRIKKKLGLSNPTQLAQAAWITSHELAEDAQ